MCRQHLFIFSPLQLYSDAGPRFLSCWTFSMIDRFCYCMVSSITVLFLQLSCSTFLLSILVFQSPPRHSQALSVDLSLIFQNRPCIPITIYDCCEYFFARNIDRFLEFCQDELRGTRIIKWSFLCQLYIKIVTETERGLTYFHLFETFLERVHSWLRITRNDIISKTVEKCSRYFFTS